MTHVVDHASDLHRLHTALTAAKTAEDAFGALSSTTEDGQLAELASAFKRMAVIAHEDRATDATRATAHDAFVKLNSRYHEAILRVQWGVYGTAAAAPAPATVKTDRDVYTFRSPEWSGALAHIYKATDQHGQTVHLKLSKHPSVNRFLVREYEALTAIQKGALATSRMAHYYPNLIDSADVVDGATKTLRRINVSAWRDDYVSLDTVGKLPPVHVVWIGNRLWTALWFAHAQGWIHTAIAPEHVLINPATHGAMLIDWCYAVKHGDRVTPLVRHDHFLYPKEIWEKLPAGPQTDIYMVAGLLRELSDGPLPPALDRVLDACRIINRARRPADAWGVHQHWREAAFTAFGQPRFVPLVLKNTTTR